MCFTEPWQVKIFLYILSYAVIVVIGAPLIRMMLSKYIEEIESEKGGLTGAGKMIGILERILVITFVYIGEPAAISIIFAAKSIVRFPMISQERKFAEYFLIGTLISITFALIIGIITLYLVNSKLDIIYKLFGA